MTDVGARAGRTQPGFAVRIAWVLHRGLYRFSGGRFGLSRPKAGSKFGMLRLATVGRRTGQPRIAIVGYFEDGPNLVTLAMNGWGPLEPAWWLNLQAQPDATVGLADGPRAVRARAATGEERDRLWARVPDFPGWGDNLDALAMRRSTDTAVVVLEPHASLQARRQDLSGLAPRSQASAVTPGRPDAVPSGSGAALNETRTLPG